MALPYERLSAVYDFDLGGWSAGLLAVLERELARQGPGPHVALDLGCGTGALVAELASRGVEVVGVDRSPQMVAVARARHPGLRFEVGDIMTPWVAGRDAEPFPGTRNTALVTATADVVNYATDLAGLRGLLSNAARALRPGGVLLFDSTTRALYAHHHHGVYERELDGAPLRVELRWDAEAQLAHTHFTFADGETEHHLQRPWEPDVLRPLLLEAGFSPPEFLSGPDGEPFTAHTERLFCLARRPPAAVTS